MQAVNKKMDPKKTLQTMQDFQKENMKMETTEDMSEYIFILLGRPTMLRHILG